MKQASLTDFGIQQIHVRKSIGVHGTVHARPGSEGINLSHVIQSLATYKEKQIASIDVELLMAGYLGEGKTGT